MESEGRRGRVRGGDGKCEVRGGGGQGDGERERME